MDAVKFMKEFRRMCESVTDCKNCPLGIMRIPEYKNVCTLNVFLNAEFSIQAIEQWSKEHPKKTRLDDFKEKYPLAKVKDENGKYNFCCSDLGYCQCKYFGDGCSQCWNEPVD